MAPALDIPPHSYGPLIESTLRVVTWNVWGRYGPWEEREPAIFATLHDAQPDIVVLSESWAKGEDGQRAPGWRCLSTCRTTPSAASA